MGANGQALRTVRTELVCVGEYDLPVDYRMRRHVHRGPGLVLGLGGAWIGTLAARREHVCARGELVVLPEGADHSERSGAAGSRCLLLTFAGELEPATRALLRRDARLPARATWTELGERLAAALRRGPAAAARVDELVCELLARVAPARDPAGDERWLRAVREALDAAPLDEVDLGALAAIAGRTREHVCRRFHRAFGVSPGSYLRARRLEQAAGMLASDARPIAAVALDCGFSDQSHLARWFRARFGVTPGRFRRERTGR